MLNTLKCDICGGNLIVQTGGNLVACGTCGIQYSVERIREKAQEAKKINSVGKSDENMDFDIRAGELVAYHGSGIDVVIPDGVLILGDHAFPATGAIRSVVIPGSVKEIRGAFDGCKSLENVIIAIGVTIIGDSAFKNCSSLKNVTFPNSVTEIGQDAFNGCTSLVDVNLPDCLTTLGTMGKCYDVGKHSETGGAFEGCNSLKKIKIPDHVTQIGSRTFAECTSLIDVEMSKSVIKIGRESFEQCISLQKIEVPDNVAEIGFAAFRGCKRLKIIKLPSGVRLQRDYDSYDDDKSRSLLLHGCSSLESIEYCDSISAEEIIDLCGISDICNEKKSPWLKSKMSTIWRNGGKCQYCGSDFWAEGILFHKFRCKKCGRLKDY